LSYQLACLSACSAQAGQRRTTTPPANKNDFAFFIAEFLKIMTKNTPRKAKILCVDDDSALLAIYTKYLENTEYESRTAVSAEEGLETAKKFVPDIIISDVVMQGESGLNFCKKIKKLPYLSTSIFIFASGLAVELDDVVKGLDIGADDYFIKPINKKELLAKIRSFLRIKSQRDELVYANKKLSKAFKYLKSYKDENEKKNKALFKEKEMLQNSLKQISLLVKDRERTNKKLELYNKAHQKSFNSVITILSTIIDSKRQYHRGHSKKVSEISIFIAGELKLSKVRIRNIKIAALLHEIGKLSFSDRLTMKNPEKYSQKERDFLYQHPVKGAALLEKFSGFEKIAKIIRHIHENFDGTGVPDGLRGDEIPIGSRIISAAGIFDNLVYRKKNTLASNELERIEEETGTKYDPTVVRFLRKYANLYPADKTDKIKELSVYDLKPGMKLASGIFTASGTKLLPIGSLLTEDSINQIARHSKLGLLVETVFIEEIE